jgi:hypothetical protein
MAVVGFLIPASDYDDPLARLEVAIGFAAHLACLLDRRIEVPAEIDVAVEDRPGDRTAVPLGGLPDRSLLAPLTHEPNDVDPMVREHLARMAGLGSADADAVAAAIDLHYGACLLVTRDLATAYTLLVAGIETLAQQFGTPSREWSDWQESTRWGPIR